MKKNYKLKKAEFGVQKVDVPPGGSMGDVAQSAIAGASAGAAFGPWGAAIGAVGGTAIGFISKGKKDREKRDAVAKNLYQEQMSKYTGGNQYQADQVLRNGSKNLMTKPIEIEGDEPVFTKNKGKFKLKYLANNGPSHEEGGIPFNAKDGDVIFPKNQKSTVMRKYKSGDHKGLESMRQNLPEDKPQKARGGYNGDPEEPDIIKNINRYRYASKIDPRYAKITTPPSTRSIQPLVDPKKYIPQMSDTTNPFPKDNGWKMTKDSVAKPEFKMKSVIPGKSVTASDPDYLKRDVKPKGKFDVNSGIALANTAYNLIKGMSPAEKTPRNYVTLDKLKYKDTSDPDRLNSTQARDVNRYNRQNYGGGNSANLQAGLAQDSADDFYRKQSINQKEREVSLNVQNQNVGIQSQEEKINKSTMDQADYYDAQNRAMKDSYTETGINELTNQAQQNIRTKEQRAVDDQRFDLANSMYQNYQVKRDEENKMKVGYIQRKGNKSVKVYKMKGGKSK